MSQKKPFRCKSILTRVALKKSPKVLKVHDQVERGVFKMEYRAQERLRNCRKVVFWKVTFFGGAITGEGLGTNGTFGAPCPAGQFFFYFNAANIKSQTDVKLKGKVKGEKQIL